MSGRLSRVIWNHYRRMESQHQGMYNWRKWRYLWSRLNSSQVTQIEHSPGIKKQLPYQEDANNPQDNR